MQFVFYLGNLFALLCWGVLILAPKSHLAKQLSVAKWPLFVLTIIYTVFLGQALIGWLPGTSLEDFFAVPSGLYAGWTHYLVLDLFAGQYIYQRTQYYGWGYILNQLLTLAAAPLGLVLFCTESENIRPLLL